MIISEKAMAPHSSTLAWKIPRTEEPGGLQSMGSLRVGQDFTFTFHFPALEKKMATHSSVLAWRIPGTEEPSGLPSMESHRVRHDWSDLAAAAADDDNLAQLDKMIWSHLDSAVSFTAFFQIFKMGELFFLPILYLKNALIYFCSCTYLETTEYLSHFCRCACLPLKCTTKS